MSSNEKWSVFRGNSRRTGYLPVFSKTCSPILKYKVKAGDYLYSSPIFSDKVHLLSYSSSRSGIYTFEPTNGKLCWVFDLEMLPPYPWYTAAAYQDIIYVSDYGSFSSLSALTGQSLNRSEQGDGWFSLTSPVYDSEMIYIGSNYMCLHAFDHSSLEIKWSFRIERNITADTALSDDAVFVVSQQLGTSFIQCVEKGLGKELWTFAIENASVRAAPVVSGEIVYIVSFRFRIPQSCSVYALNTHTGLLIWQKDFNSDVLGGNFRIKNNHNLLGSSPAVTDEEIYLILPNGQLYCINKVSQEINWSYDSLSQIECSPAISRDAIYFGTSNGVLHALDRHTGLTLWDYQASSSICASPALDDASIYFGSIDGWFYSISL